MLLHYLGKVNNSNLILIYCKLQQKKIFKKTEATKLLAITFSNLNRFSKFYHCKIEDEYFQQNCVIFSTTPELCCYTTLGKLIIQSYCKLQQKKIKKRVVFDKNETFMLSYGWLEIGVLFLQHMLEVSTVRLHACTKTLDISLIVYHCHYKVWVFGSITNLRWLRCVVVLYEFPAFYHVFLMLFNTYHITMILHSRRLHAVQSQTHISYKTIDKPRDAVCAKGYPALLSVCLSVAAVEWCNYPVHCLGKRNCLIIKCVRETDDNHSGVMANLELGERSRVWAGAHSGIQGQSPWSGDQAPWLWKLFWIC